PFAVRAVGGCDGILDLRLCEGLVCGERLTRGRVDDGVISHVRSSQFGISVYLVDRYSWMPSAPPSRPTPDCLTPPNGAAAFETTPTFRPIMPVSSASIIRWPLARSSVKTY